MSPKCVLLLFTTYLLVQGSFGKSILKPPKTNSFALSFDFEEFKHFRRDIFFLKQFANALRSNAQFMEGVDSDTCVKNFLDSLKKDVRDYYNAMSSEEQEKKKAFVDFVDNISMDNADSFTLEEKEENIKRFAEFFDLTKFDLFRIRVIARFIDSSFVKMDDAAYKTAIENLTKEYYDSLEDEESAEKENAKEFLEKFNNFVNSEEFKEIAAKLMKRVLKQ